MSEAGELRCDFRGRAAISAYVCPALGRCRHVFVVCGAHRPKGGYEIELERWRGEDRDALRREIRTRRGGWVALARLDERLAAQDESTP